MIGTANRVHQRDKIVTIQELPRIRERFADRSIVQCHGAFDLIHPGHLTHFEEARALGDLLVVTITGDRHITKKRAVSFAEEQRARQVAALELIDYVAIIQEPTALSAIEALHPDLYVKGPEYADLLLDKSRSIYHEMRVLETYGGKIHFTSGETFSSTKLSHFLLAASDAAQRDPLLRNDPIRFKDISSSGFTLDQLKQFLAKAAPLRVCVVGETIVDEWVDVALTNLSTQSRCVAGLETARVRQIGGAGIIARHLANFVSEVHCYSNGPAGECPANLHHWSMADGELVETRFVDAETGRPVFKSKSMTLANVRPEALPVFDDYDLVLVADFGHGLLDGPPVNRRLAEHHRATVAAMAQVNSSNYGYNLPLKYVGADYYSLNRREAELCLHERHLTSRNWSTARRGCFNARPSR
jgi:cytidyltransferase-like protein